MEKETKKKKKKMSNLSSGMKIEHQATQEDLLMPACWLNKMKSVTGEYDYYQAKPTDAYQTVIAYTCIKIQPNL